jgi:hypothetical protein
MSSWAVYWITRFDVVRQLFICSVAAGIATIVLGFLFLLMFEEDLTKKSIHIMAYGAFVGFVSMIFYFMTPTTEQALLIYSAPMVNNTEVNNTEITESIQKTSHKK